MSEQQNNVGYGYVSDTDESLQSKTGGHFGGNFGSVFLSKFSFVPSVTKEGGEVSEPVLQAVFMIGDKEVKYGIRAVNAVYINNVKVTDFSSPEAQSARKAELMQNGAVITHILKAVGVTEEAIKVALSTPFASFEEFAKKVESLLPVGYQNIPLDLFMEYQWNFATKQDGTSYDKTYPIVPKNMKGGYWLVKARPGKWEATTDDKGNLIYVNQDGASHPFTRTKDFMESNKGKQQVAGQETKSGPMAPSAGASAPKSNGDW